MGRIAYQVPMRRQRQNPICWVACMAMISSFKTGTSLGIEQFADGYSPTNSSLAEPAGNSWPRYYGILSAHGFRSVGPKDISPDTAYVEGLLRDHGPFSLFHDCGAFSYGPQRAGQQFGPNDTHAVVVTGIDTDRGRITFNNPWGDVDVPTSIRSILQSIVRSSAQGVRPISYMP